MVIVEGFLYDGGFCAFCPQCHAPNVAVDDLTMKLLCEHFSKLFVVMTWDRQKPKFIFGNSKEASLDSWTKQP